MPGLPARFLIAGCLALSAPATPAQTEPPQIVRIGVVDSLTGSFASIGQPPTAALRLAAREINERGGFIVNGTTYRFDVTEADNRSLALENSAAMSKLVDEAGIRFIFGPTQSPFAVQAAAVTVPARVLHFSAATSWQTRGFLSDPNRPLMFGLQVPAAHMAQVEAASLKALGATRVAYLSQDDDVTRNASPPFLTAFKANGLAASLIAFPTGTSDFTPYLARARDEKFDAIYLAWPPNIAPEALRTAIRLGAGPAGIGGRAIPPGPVVSGALGNPVTMPFFSSATTPWLEFPANDKVAALATRIKAFSPYLPVPFINGVFYTYDAIHMLAEAMKRAGTVEDTSKIAAELGKMTYDGVAGKMCFGSSVRTAMYDTGLVIVRDGKIESRTLPGTCQ
jgi:branched-chain amino acid transport system substrate-binding protein